MPISQPKPIRDYYIAYFDILGYKEFFKEHPDKAPELLKAIHEAIQRTKNQLSFANNSPILNGMGHIDVYSKIFSDNIFLCMEVNETDFEPVRLLAFIQLVSDIQRGFVNEYGLFVRGSLLKGKVSVDDDYVFGQGLIEAVQMEAEALYPRIVIDEEIIEYLHNFTICSKEDMDKAVLIERKIAKKESINPDELELYCRVVDCVQMQLLYNSVALRLVQKWMDEKWIISYLSQICVSSLLGNGFKENALHMIEMMSPPDYKLLQQPSESFDVLLAHHKTQVEEQLKKYGHNMDIATGDVIEAELREKILRKYVWVMAYHNAICEQNQKNEFKIYTQCNCDTRFLKMTIEVQTNNS